MCEALLGFLRSRFEYMRSIVGGTTPEEMQGLSKQIVKTASDCLTRVHNVDSNTGLEIQALVRQSELEKADRDMLQALVNSKVGIDDVEPADSSPSELPTLQRLSLIHISEPTRLLSFW